MTVQTVKDASSQVNLALTINIGTVILRYAQGQARWAERSFAEFTLSAANVLSMTKDRRSCLLKIIMRVNRLKPRGTFARASNISN